MHLPVAGCLRWAILPTATLSLNYAILRSKNVFTILAKMAKRFQWCLDWLKKQGVTWISTVFVYFLLRWGIVVEGENVPSLGEKNV